MSAPPQDQPAAAGLVPASATLERTDAGEHAPDGNASAERGRIRASAAGMGLWTLASRVAGLARESITAMMFGLSAAMSAFTAAYQFPNLVRAFVADVALSMSVVPVFSDLIDRDERERAWRVASTVATILLMVTIPTCAVCIVFAPELMTLTLKRSFPEFDLAVDLFRILVPMVVFLAISGVVIAILHTFNHFWTPAIAPLAWNLITITGLIVGMLALTDVSQMYLYAVAVLAGTIIQFAIPLPYLRGRGGRLRLTLDLQDPAVRAIFRMMLPITAGLVFASVIVVVNLAYAARVPESLVEHGAGPALVDKAWRLYMVPQGMFSLAVSTVFYPLLVRYFGRSEPGNFASTVAYGLRTLFVLLLPTSALLAALSIPTVQLLYQRGAFTAVETPQVAATLVAFATGLAFNGMAFLLIRTFFAIRKPWVPVYTGAGYMVLSILLIHMSYQTFGVVGIAASSSVAQMLGFIALYVLLARQGGVVRTRENILAFCGAVIASLAAAGLGWVIQSTVESLLGDGIVGLVLSLAAGYGGALALYIVVAMRLKLIGRSTLATLLRRRAAPPPSAG